MEMSGRLASEGIRAVTAEDTVAGPYKKPRVWILVADKHTAKIYRKPDGRLELIGEAVPSELDVLDDIPDESIGRASRSGIGVARHKMEPHMPPGRKHALAFADDVASWLEEAVVRDAFDRLVVAAAPKMLGDLRKATGKKVKRRIVAEVSKDLTKMSKEELGDELDKIVEF